jgi:hypothetical protein
MDMATSISVRFIIEGILIRFRNKLLPNPAVPVTVPALETIVPATSCKLAFCVYEHGAPILTMVMLDPPLVRLIPDPATRVVWAGAEMLTDPFPTPTLAPAIPENARTLFIVPEELDVVFPDADRDTVENTGALFEIVTVNEPAPVAVANDIPAPAASASDTPVPVTEFAPALND